MSAGLADLISPAQVMAGVVAASRRSLFQQIGTAAAPIVGADAKLLAEALMAREKLGSTGFGGGVAIPHAKIEGVRRIVGFVATLFNPIDFRAVDGAPVDIVFALFSPVDAGASHLKALARVSRRLRDRAFVAKLRGTRSHDALWAMLDADEAKAAA